MAEKLFDVKSLDLDWEKESERICKFVKSCLIGSLKRQGIVVALSGGIDSSTVAALCVKAVGKERVLGLLLPERDSSPETATLSRKIAEFLGIEYKLEDITPILNALGCYDKRDNAIRGIIPELESNWKVKIVLPSVLDTKRMRLFSVIAQKPDGTTVVKQLDHKAYLGIVAATNFKQRVRTMLAYYNADRLNYAVAGTPNRLEYDQGFFVKLGDGAADIKPIAHLYKTQVYGMAKYFNLPEAIIRRPPTTDTYSLSQSQEEFYFSLPYDKMDLCLYGYNNGITMEKIMRATGLSEEQVKRIFEDIEQKRKTTLYLHLEPQLVERILDETWK